MMALLALASLTASAQDVHVRVDPSAPHAAPGNENRTIFPTIQNAMDHHPWPGPGGRVYIEIAPGTYHERVIITQNHPNITLIGMGKTPADTVITNSLNAKQAGGTFFTETVEINAPGFEADNLTFENSAGNTGVPGELARGGGNTGQAVAVADRSDRSIFKHCRFLGHQDTLFADHGRQYYVDSYIEGGVDYIFGNAAAVFDRDMLNSNGPGFITAQSRTSADQPTGYVILNSKVTSTIDAAMPRKSIGLGRPWRPYSRVVYINTELPADLSPAGWNNWGRAANESTAYYAESGSTGPGANPKARVLWSHQITAAEAKQFLPAAFLAGSDHWDPEAAATLLP